MRKFFICVLIVIVLAMASFFVSCRKSISEFTPGMSKQEVIDAWGDKAIKTFRTIDGRTFEVWQYNFKHRCYLVFENDRLIETSLGNPPPILRIKVY